MRPSALLRHRYAWAALAGLGLACAFPDIGIAGFAWVAPGAIAAAALAKAKGEAFRIGYVAGIAHYLLSLHWLLNIPYRWHGIPLGPAVGWIALSLFLALFPGLWVWFLFPTPAASPLAETLSPGPASATWSSRGLWCLSGAAAWVAMEMLISRIFTGFPWNLLGSSQFQMVPLIQIASVTGIYGVSFLAVWFGLCLLCAFLLVLRKPGQRSIWIADLLLPLLTLAVLFNVGLRLIRHEPPATRQLRVAFVQPSIPQTLIWDSSRDDERFAEVIQLSRLAMTNQPDLLLWPEAAVPKLLRYFSDMLDPIATLARTNHAWVIVGADDMEPAPSGAADDREYFNCSFLINPEGRLVNRYAKRRLVIFGEYIPLVRWLPFVKWFTPIEGGFTPGPGPVPFHLANLGVNLSILICFEDTFPHLARRYVDKDTDFLVNLTNNGWFGEGAAQWQHASAAVFRAIENGVPLLRCSNNGVTCWVDQHGRIHNLLFDAQGRIYGPATMTVQIPVPAPSQYSSRTIYHRYGDGFGWACVLWTLLQLGRRLLHKRLDAATKQGSAWSV